MDSDELKPCPFCGGEAEVLQHDWGPYYDSNFAVECKDCQALMEFFDEVEEAVKGWNSRKAEEGK